MTNPDTGNMVGRYWYDDQGFRVRKVAHETSGEETIDTEVLYPSMYFGLEKKRYANGGDVENSHCAVNNVYLNGIRVAAVLPSGKAFYYLTDQVDSVKVVVNDSGMPVSRMEYLPFGDTWFQEGDLSHNPKYNSQELDKETGYYFYNARHYDAGISRFVTPDTVIDGEYSTQGWNRYAYVHNNPIRYKDPTGHSGASGSWADDVDSRIENNNNFTKEDLSARNEAIKNYNAETKSTTVNGIKFQFADNNGCTKDKIKSTSPRLWKNVADAAVKSNVTEIGVNSLNYGGKGSHGMGVAMDIGKLSFKDGTSAVMKRTYDPETKSWSKIENYDKAEKFVESFINKGNGAHAWDPQKMRYGKVTQANEIDNYKTDSLLKSKIMYMNDGPQQTDAYQRWAKNMEFDNDKTNKVWEHAVHQDHLHLHVSGKYRTDQ